MEEDGMRGVFGTHGKRLTTIMVGRPVEMNLLEDLYIDGSILKWSVKKQGGRVGLGSSGSGLGPVTGYG
jgi:hypothetical protein